MATKKRTREDRRRAKENPQPPGRKPYVPTPAQIDRAKELLGRRQYCSRVVADLVQQYKICRESAYTLVEAAQREVLDSLTAAGQAADPLTAQYLFLQSVVADADEDMRHRLYASSVIVKMLGLKRFLEKMDSGGVEAFLANVMAQRATRGATPIT